MLLCLYSQRELQCILRSIQGLLFKVLRRWSALGDDEITISYSSFDEPSNLASESLALPVLKKFFNVTSFPYVALNYKSIRLKQTTIREWRKFLPRIKWMYFFSVLGSQCLFLVKSTHTIHLVPSCDNQVGTLLDMVRISNYSRELFLDELDY